METSADAWEKQIIEANCRAYDRLDRKEARNDRKAEIAEKAIGKIKSIKKLIKD